jgi:hypothetical protein
MQELILERLKEALIRGVIWGFIGILFGSLFITVYHFDSDGPIPPLLLAGTLSTGLGAMIYGSMRLAVIIAAFCSVLAVASLIFAGPESSPLAMILRTGSLGLVIGALYGAFARNSRINRADAKTITGLMSGALVSGLFYLGLTYSSLELPLGVIVALLCPLAGFVYTRLIETFLRWFQNLLPPVGDGALVGAGVAVYIGVGLWLVAGYIDPQILGKHAVDATSILNQLPGAVFGGLAGGFVGGFIGGMLGMKWQDL